jgi:lincosamide nucleotidyltransferase A/C/D/E
MVSAEEAVYIYRLLSADGIPVWLTGGWGIDALLGEQTRPHKDLDIILLLDDVQRMRILLSGEGFGLKELWSENRWDTDAQGVEIATAFVLQHADGREIDAHALRMDEQGNGIPAWDSEGLTFKRQDLAGKGKITGFAVRCLSPEIQVVCHTGYQLPDVQRRDLELLHKKYSVGDPDAQ